MIEIFADIFCNIMETLYLHNVRRRGFMRFCKIFAVIQSVKVGSKIDFSCFLMKFHPKSILRKNFSLRDEVSFDILVCYWVLLLLDEDHVKKKFLNRCIPFLTKLKNRKCRFRQKIEKTKSNFEIVAEICDT